MTEHFTLPERLDSSAAPALLAALRAHMGKPLVLDADGVELIGALAFEVIIAAGRQWEADGQTLSVHRPSTRFAAACRTLGLCCEAPWQGIEIGSAEKRELGE
ncbi:STAS domain-containing protein [Tabrizicola sp. M-4]|uniref:STAS domain-containing protein n=1 Tax=Tabrizicola sp. M-4 TaxID=3055847 RepID=UPI003DA7DF56